ncbi:4'-phosphopantetheinyl transferase family protein [Streptomyces sp. NPDC090045]|uniref:4'-phosphopantetheinyl transferase family protein n=1 Tax=Streptomyces sp. NPDC090045 TaxID=3365927 RepID=UPI003804FF46
MTRIRPVAGSRADLHADAAAGRDHDPAAELSAPRNLPADTVHVWCLDLDELVLPDGGDCLDAQERQRAARLQHAADRRRHRAAHCALRHILAGCTGQEPAALRTERRCPRCGPSPHGKPVWSAGAGRAAVDVNLSHSDHIAMVAVARAPLSVGIDVERVRAGIRWATVLADPDAGSGLSDQDGTRIWTRLEAVGKAAGTGMADRPVLGGAQPGGWTAASVPALGGGWSVRDLAAPQGFVAALAVDALPANRTVTVTLC